MSTYFEAAGQPAPWQFDVPYSEPAQAAAEPMPVAANYAAASAIEASFDDINSTVRRELLVGVPIGEQPVAIADIRDEIASISLTLEEAAPALENPAHLGARFQLLGAVAEATKSDGSAWRAAAHVVRGLGHMANADREPLAEHRRPPVSRRHLVKAGMLALSGMVPGEKSAQWRIATATELTNHR